MWTQSSLSTEMYPIRVTATDYAGNPVDPSSDIVQIAFVGIGAEPVTGDWHTATWLSSEVVGILVGPAPALAVAEGDHSAWVKVTDDPERPAREVGVLRIT